MYYQIQTLIDITETRQHRMADGRERARNQQQNFQTIIQTVGLRSNIYYDKSPECKFINVADLGFGKHHQGEHNVWTFTFKSELDYVFEGEFGACTGLIVDFDMIPIIANLDETVKLIAPAFFTRDIMKKNIIFKVV